LRGASAGSTKRLSDLNIAEAAATVRDEMNYGSSALEEESKTGAVSNKSAAAKKEDLKIGAPSPSIVTKKKRIKMTNNGNGSGG
jgi:hypothetical protein